MGGPRPCFTSAVIWPLHCRSCNDGRVLMLVLGNEGGRAFTYLQVDNEYSIFASLPNWVVLHIGTICRDSRKTREKIRGGAATVCFSRGFFLSFEWILCVPLSKALHIAIISCFLVATTTQYTPLGVNTDKYATLFSVLWRRKTWNNDEFHCWKSSY